MKKWSIVIITLITVVMIFSPTLFKLLDEQKHKTEAIELHILGVNSHLKIYTTEMNVTPDFENYIKKVLVQNNWNLKSIRTQKSDSGITYIVHLKHPVTLDGLDFFLKMNLSSFEIPFKKPVPIMVRIPKPFRLELSPEGIGLMTVQTLDYQIITIAPDNKASLLTIRGFMSLKDIILLTFKAVGILIVLALLLWGYIIRFYRRRPSETTLLNLVILNIVLLAVYFFWLLYTGYYTLAGFYFGFLPGLLFSCLPLFLGILILLGPLFMLGVRLKYRDVSNTDVGKVFFKMSAIKGFPLFLVAMVQLIWISLPVSYSDIFIVLLNILTVLATFVAAPWIIDFVWRPLKPSSEIKHMVSQVMVTPVVVRIIDFKPYKEANASVTGVFPGLKRLYLTKDLLGILTPEELRAVICHEQGHLSGKHLPVTFAVIVLFILTTYQINYHFEYKFWPFFGLVLVFILILGMLSHWFEHRADLFAANCCGQTAVISALSKIQAFNAPDSEVAITLTHPQLQKRIAYILRKGDLCGK